ncbi:forkhead domain-containing protein [Purpureocillium lilacinum]|nr:forkhead domain-containing protein [Purpureocillium lilacinum]OAQ81065.1 forkhead domain-containing protein [Purpureocillium lilacinum]GJN76197.1 hypothetical protein PLICBS_010309 [Purpureocillium lilacinum]
MASSSDGRDGPGPAPAAASATPAATVAADDARAPSQNIESASEGELLAATAAATQQDPSSSSAPAPTAAPASSEPTSGAPAMTTGETAVTPAASASAAAPAPDPAAVTSQPSLDPTAAAAAAAPAQQTAGVAQTPDPAPVPAQPSTPPSNKPQPVTLDRPSTPRAAAVDRPNPSGGDSHVDEPMPDAPASTPANAGIQSQVQNQMQPSQQQHQNANMQPRNDDQYPPSTPFTPAAMSNIDQQAYMMMAFMSGAQSAMSPPPTVTPAQVTLPNPMDGELNGFAANNNLRQAAADKGLESFARIEFADSVFQMTTYAVIIGRDQRALEQARRDERRAEEHKRRIEENASKGLPPPSPIHQDRSKFSKSYVSEEGGMLGPESDSEENGRPAKRRKTSTTGSSQKDNDESQENMISNRQYVSHTPGAAAVDLTSLRPSPWHVPFIGIHSPGPDIASKTKAISREHLRIAYNQKEGVFEAIPLHKNGFFRDDIHYKSDKVVLHCGDRLQIKDVDFRFMINGVERGCTGAEEYKEEEPAKKRKTHGGKEMSFDFEQSHGNGEIQDTSDELSDVEVSPPELSDFGEDAEGDEAEEPTAEVEEAAEEPTPEMKPEPVPVPEEPVIPQIPKKRGPGRPPKNGVMSKREQRLLKKQQQEMAKKTLPQAPPVEPPVKRKVGRPRKHPLPENAGDRPEKRKYKPRKPKTEDGAEGSDAERRAREKKEKKVRPKSPPLELKIEDYTEEQLQKPNKNYGVLIDETLTAAGPDGLTLKQIYKRICQRYPWFYFHTETKGWESSVRHNLIGNEAFKKDETTNLWSRVPGVELDAGKKRKATSPDRALAAQGYGPYSYPFNAAQHLPPGAPGFPPGQAPHGYQMPQFAGQPGQPGQPPRPMQPYGNSASPPTGPPPVAAAQPPPPAHVPGYGPPPAPARPQLGGPQPGTYSSPYASRPPPPATAPVKTEDGAVPAPAPVAAQPPAAAPAPVSVAPAAAGARPVAGPAPTSQPAAASGSRPSATSATPPANAPPRPVIDPRLLTAVVGLKTGLVENLKKARNPKAEAIVMSALNRCIGLKTAATENDKMEAICIKGIRQVIEGFTKKNSPTPGGTTTQPDIPPIFEAKVFQSLTGFKDVSVKALSARLGDARAEAVTLSSIDRVLGLADATIVAPPAEGEQGGNFEGVEQHLMKSLRQLLRGMNQQLQEPK